MGVPFRGPAWRAPRPLHSLRYRIALVAIFVIFIQQQRLFFIYRNAIAAKYSPTIFDDIFDQQRWQIDNAGAHLQNELLANRGSWKLLGSGFEGAAFSYEDIVIKTFTPARSPFRNCAAPNQDNLKWPTEIPASLLFGNRMATTKTNSSGRDEMITGFLPIKTYFKDATIQDASPEWYLATPLLNMGNLDSLSKYIRNNHSSTGFRDLDGRYRPSFNRLLRTLESMHSIGFCHDDVKPSNIFVQDDSHWILGDLGNVRHVSHPYHSSRIWMDNEQIPDCRANDVVRALKSYLHFLRVTSDDAATFDIEFFECRTPLSKLFWEVKRDSRVVTAEDLRTRSLAASPSYKLEPSATLSTSCPVQPSTLLQMLFSGRKPLRQEVTHILRTPLSEQYARRMAMTWIFGIPETRC